MSPNPRLSSVAIPATTAIPGDVIVHPVSRTPRSVDAVSRVGDVVVLTLRGDWPLTLPSSYRLGIRGR
jgi:hypothetical protein